MARAAKVVSWATGVNQAMWYRHLSVREPEATLWLVQAEEEEEEEETRRLRAVSGERQETWETRETQERRKTGESTH